jgi:hypothetical protein
METNRESLHPSTEYSFIVVPLSNSTVSTGELEIALVIVLARKSEENRSFTITWLLNPPDYSHGQARGVLTTKFSL